MLGNLVAGVRVLSVGQYSLGIANSIAHDTGLNAHLSLATAVVMGVLVVTAAALVIAGPRGCRRSRSRATRPRPGRWRRGGRSARGVRARPEGGAVARA